MKTKRKTIEIKKWYKTKNEKFNVYIEKKEVKNLMSPYIWWDEHEIEYNYTGKIFILRDNIIHSYEMEYNKEGEALDSKFDLEIKEIAKEHDIRETIKEL